MPVEEIELLRSLRFSWTRIAALLEISRSTLYRRLEEEGISLSTTFSNISDMDLDRVIQTIKADHPNDGERLIIGHLTRQNLILPRTRVRASIHRVDHEGTLQRRSVTVRRRTYHSEGPNFVWHIDGNHKLIKWRFVLHGSIDGYSRVITFLHCSDNNRATTVLSLFTSAVNKLGLPYKIRTDLGGENVELWRYMIEQHADDSAIITGSSTHNERIERLWRDVHRCVGVVFADTFRELEEEGKLDSLNEIDLYCLHYVYKPRINHALEAFIESWNNHCISTEGGSTPYQLFIQGAIENNMFPVQPQPYGTNPQDGSNSSQVAGQDHVRVPRIDFQPCGLLCLLLSAINPLQESDCLGCDIYTRVINVVGQHLQGCNDCELI